MSIIDKMERWSKEMLESGSLNRKVGDDEILAFNTIYPPGLIALYVMTMGVGSTIEQAFVMGMLWQRFLDKEDSGFDSSLLNDVNLG